MPVMMNLLNAVTKCEIAEVDNASKKVTAHYNPKDLTIKSGAKWGVDPKPGDKQSPTVKFQGTNPRTFSMTLLFDDSWLPLGLLNPFGGGGVVAAVDQMFKWTQPTDISLQKKQPTAPMLKVTWGDLKALSFTVFLGE